jgi:hypothetical protein
VVAVVMAAACGDITILLLRLSVYPSMPVHVMMMLLDGFANDFVWLLLQ